MSSDHLNLVTQNSDIHRSALSLFKHGKSIRPFSTALRGGVIQGGVLDPILFPLYLKAILEVGPHCMLYLFAEINNPVYSFETITRYAITALVNEDLTDVNSWCTKWLIKLSAQALSTHAIALSVIHVNKELGV